MTLPLQVINGTAPRRSAQVTRSASKDKENLIFGSSENDSSGTAVATTARVAKTELAKLKKAPDQVTAKRDAARTEADAIRSARDAIHSERDDGTDANAPTEGLEAELGVANEDTGLGFVNVTTLAKNIAGVEAVLNATNDDADAGLLRATSLVENNVRGLDDADNDADDDADGDADGNADSGLEADVRVVELSLNDTNDGSDAGLLRATALAEIVGGLDDADEDADDDAGSGLETDAGFENVYVLAEKEVGRGAESDVRRVRRSVDFDAHDDVVAGLVSAGPIEMPSRWALETINVVDRWNNNTRLDDRRRRQVRACASSPRR